MNITSISSIQLTKNLNNSYKDIINEFPHLSKPIITKNILKHDVLHNVETRGYPFSAKTLQLTLEKYQLAKREFKTIEELGIVRQSNSQWSFSPHMENQR